MAEVPPNHEAIASKQAEINWFAPDAYATPSAFKQAVAHGQRLKGTGRMAEEWTGSEVAAKLREAAGRLGADDPKAGKLRADAQLVEDQGRLLESTSRELKAAQAEAPMDAARVNELQRRASQLKEVIASRAEKIIIAELMGETAPTDKPSAERLSESAAASGANMGMLHDHVRHASNIDGKVKAAAKYAARIAMAELLSGLRPAGDAISRLLGEFVKSRWGIAEDISPELLRDMFLDYAKLTNRTKDIVYGEAGPVGVTDDCKQAFVHDVMTWAGATNDGIQAAAIGSKAFTSPVPPAPAPGGTQLTGSGGASGGGSSGGSSPVPAVGGKPGTANTAPSLPAQDRPTIPVPAPDNGPATVRDGAGGPGAAPKAPAERPTTDPSGKLTEVPGGIRIARDQTSVTVHANAQSDALVRIEPVRNTLRLTDIFRRDMPAGTGVILLAEALKAVNAVRGNEILVHNIRNPETIESHKAGQDAATSKLGKTVARALEEVGLKAGPARWEHVDEKLCIVIDIE